VWSRCGKVVEELVAVACVSLSLKTNRISRSVLTGLSLLFWSVSDAQAQDYQVPVDDSFVEGQIRFTGELGVVYRFLWNGQAVNGELAICGIGRFISPRLRTTVRGMARGAVLRINGQEYPFDVSFFTSARTVASMQTEPATCRSTGVPLSRVNGPITLEYASGSWRN
jgi:hypothetical protein